MRKEGTQDFLIVCLYVDDLIYTGNNPKMVKNFKSAMMKEYEMTDLGLMKYFLGIQVQQSKGEIFISQEKYVEDLLKRFQMSNCKPISIPIALNENYKSAMGRQRSMQEIIEAWWVLSLISPTHGPTLSILLVLFQDS